MDIAAEELTVPPGMDELFSLLQIKRHHESDRFDVVIVDCAPTGETLRLLSFPDIAHWWLEKVFGSRATVHGGRPPAGAGSSTSSFPRPTCSTTSSAWSAT